MHQHHTGLRRQSITAGSLARRALARWQRPCRV